MNDGSTTRQLEKIGIGFTDVEVLRPKSILVLDKYIGIIKWSNQDMPFYEWRLIMEHPEYLVVGYADKALAVAKDGITLSLIDIDKGQILRRIISSFRIVGRPIADGPTYLIPVDGGLVILDEELNTIENYQASWLKGPIALRKSQERIYLIGERNITMIVPTI